MRGFRSKRAEMPRETWKLALRGIQRGLQQTRRENDDRRGREALMRRGIGERDPPRALSIHLLFLLDCWSIRLTRERLRARASLCVAIIYSIRARKTVRAELLTETSLLCACGIKIEKRNVCAKSSGG